jgi:DNA-binding GntR family transcriptional regulator
MACSGNHLLLDALRKANQLRRVLEYRGDLDRSRFQRICEEHLMLLELIESGDRAEAAHALRQHLTVARWPKRAEAVLKARA